MNKSLLALAALAAFAGAASAQSSVTLFGVVDLAAQSVTNDPRNSDPKLGATTSVTTKSLAQDGINSSRIGFRGIEDLGGGLRAGFWIEGAFGPDTGCGGSGTMGAPTTNCAGQTWQRRSTVSLIGNWGEIRLGRDYTPGFNNIADYDPFGYNGTSHVGNVRSNLGSPVGTIVRASNTVAYFLPTLGGLFGQFQVAAGEGSGSALVPSTTVANKEIAGRLGYAAGPIKVSGVYQKTYSDGVIGMADDYKTYGFGASWDFGFLKLDFAFEKNEYTNQDQKIYLFGGIVPIGAGQLRLSIIEAKGSTDAWGAKQYGIGYVYDLSKRTSLYTQYGRIDNDGNAALGGKFTVYGASGANGGIASGMLSSGYQFGIRHFF